MPLQTVEPQRLYRQIAEQLRQLMSSGEFAVGSRLPAERDLAVQLGVSRPSVREALIALEVEGMIEVRTGSGIYVQSTTPLKNKASATQSDAPTEWGPLEVMSARILVESEVAALAAQNAQKKDLQAIRNGLQKMKLEAARDEVPRWGDEAFHEGIAQACGNGVLLDTVQRSAFLNSGQICLCGSRILVERKVHDEVLRRMAERYEALRVGSARSPFSSYGVRNCSQHCCAAQHKASALRSCGSDLAFLAFSCRILSQPVSILWHGYWLASWASVPLSAGGGRHAMKAKVLKRSKLKGQSAERQSHA